MYQIDNVTDQVSGSAGEQIDVFEVPALSLKYLKCLRAEVVKFRVFFPRKHSQQTILGFFFFVCVCISSIAAFPFL